MLHAVKGFLISVVMLGILTMGFVQSVGAVGEAADENAGCKLTTKFDYTCNYPAQSTKQKSKRCGIGSPCTYSKGAGVCGSLGECKATTASGAGGGSMNVNPNSVMQLLNSVMQLMGKLGQGQSGGGEGGAGGGGAGGAGTGGAGTGGTGVPQGCIQYYQVSAPSSDPCAYYVPNVSNSINTNIGTGNVSNSINTNLDAANVSKSINTDTGTDPGGTGSIDAISGIGGGATGNAGSSNPISNFINTISNSFGVGDTAVRDASSTGAGTGVSVGGATGSSSVRVTPSTSTSPTRPGSGGASGEIRVLPNGVTVIVNTQNTPGNSVVAGFLGTEATGGAQPQGIVATWCRTRPWATNFLSLLIPPTFFDNLCGIRGYRVGTSPAGVPPAQGKVGSQVTLTQKKIPAQPAGATSTSPVYQPIPQSPPMRVDIWATPAAVPLGSRTTIFWTSKNAASCVEASPDGNFSHNTLSGGGATVPLAGPTTFTISCMAPDGTHATDYVTVNLTI